MTRRVASVAVPSNIAFIKYWGARDLARAIPSNRSLSMTLRECLTYCTVEHTPEPGPDEIWLAQDGGRLLRPGPEFAARVLAHLDRLRRRTGATGRFRVATRNTFPSAAGLASSASGFAALTLAATRALGLELSPRELSSLARRSGSGSAARSLFGGYVEWPAGRRDAECHAVPVAGHEHWRLCDVIALVERGPKEVSSLDGHRRVRTSPYFRTRLRRLPERLEAVREAIRARDFARLGPVLEEEAIDLHLIAMSSRPPIFYWQPGTLAVLAAVRELRRDGIAAYSTMDAGANVHVICPPESEAAVAARLEAMPEVGAVIRDGVGPGPEVTEDHLL